MQLGPGTLVTENIRLVRQLGEGGMGSVWVADHLTLKTEVAVKFIASDLLRDNPELVVRFSREASAAAQIKSPHVVQTFDHGVMEDGTPYIVMELLEGEDLGVRVERDGKLEVAEVVAIVGQAARALGKAHQAGIVHRDIKPDNIFLVDTGDDDVFVKVLDFGVAKQTQAATVSVVTSTGAMIGTPGYMSPEQVLTGKDVDLRSDLWSLGVVTYHALVGDIPFAGETLGALCVAISKGVFVPPTEARPGLPAELDGWMSKALSVDLAQRFTSARELADALEVAARSAPRAPGLGAGGSEAEARPLHDGRSSASSVASSTLVGAAVEPKPGPTRALLGGALALAVLGGGLFLLLATRATPEVVGRASDAPEPTLAAAAEGMASAAAQPAVSAAPTTSAAPLAPTASASASAPAAASVSALPSDATPPVAVPPPPSRPAHVPPPIRPSNKDRGF